MKCEVCGSVTDKNYGTAWTPMCKDCDLVDVAEKAKKKEKTAAETTLKEPKDRAEYTVQPNTIVSITKLLWVALSVGAVFLVESPFELCVLSLLFLIANAADAGVNIVIYKERGLHLSLESSINAFYLMSLFYGTGVIASVAWYLLQRYFL